jgi:hypothetical protein
MSVQVCAWLIARVKEQLRSRPPLQHGKAWFRSHSSPWIWTRQQQLTLDSADRFQTSIWLLILLAPAQPASLYQVLLDISFQAVNGI